jgi:hypothetical protein
MKNSRLNEQSGNCLSAKLLGEGSWTVSVRESEGRNPNYSKQKIQKKLPDY